MATIEVQPAYEWDRGAPWRNYSVQLDGAVLLGLDFASGDHHWFQFDYCTAHDVRPEQDGVAGPCAPCRSSYRIYARDRGPALAWLESRLPGHALESSLQAHELTLWAKTFERGWREIRKVLADSSQEDLYHLAQNLAVRFTGHFDLDRLGELEEQYG